MAAMPMLLSDVEGDGHYTSQVLRNEPPMVRYCGLSPEELALCAARLQQMLTIVPKVMICPRPQVVSPCLSGTTRLKRALNHNLRLPAARPVHAWADTFIAAYVLDMARNIATCEESTAAKAQKMGCLRRRSSPPAAKRFHFK
eukprot:6200614-Pleurochrysis_carterae.AAC.5